MKYIICLLTVCLLRCPINSYAGSTFPDQKQDHQVEISFSEAKKGDILTILLLDNLYVGERKSIEVNASMGSKGTFDFHIPVGKTCGYFLICRQLRPGEQMKYASGSKIIPLSPRFFWMAGDKVRINIVKKKKQVKWYVNPPDRFNFYFSGPSALKYRVGYAVDSTLIHTKNKKPWVFHGQRFTYANPYRESMLAAYKVLNKDSGVLDQFFINVKRADIISHGFSGVSHRVRDMYNSLLKANDSLKLQKLKAAFWNSPLAGPFYSNIPIDALISSRDYCVSQLLKQQLVYFMKHGENNPDSLYYQIKRCCSGKIRDVLLTDFFNRMRPNQLNKLYKDALVTIKMPSCLRTLDRLKRRNPGFDAYDFALPDVSGKVIHLHDLHGKAVLIDFWFTGCDGCEWYYKTVLSKVENHFKDNPQVAFVTVSIDSRKHLWLNGLNSGQYTSSQAINLFTKGLCDKNPMFQYYRIQVTPTALLIDGKGKIRLFNGSDLYNKASLINSINETIDND